MVNCALIGLRMENEMGVNIGWASESECSTSGKTAQERTQVPTSFRRLLKMHIRRLIPRRRASNPAVSSALPSANSANHFSFRQSIGKASHTGLPNASEPAQSSKQSITDELRMASVALGLATVSALVYPPAQVLALPLLLYLGVEPAQTAYHAWRADRRTTLALAETVSLTLCIARQAYWVGAFSSWCYALGRHWRAARQAQAPVSPLNWQLPGWTWLQQTDGEHKTPVAQLRPGDHIVIHAGEMVPVPGVVTGGTALVRLPSGAQQLPLQLLQCQVGQQVDTATVVQVGCMIVLVT